MAPTLSGPRTTGATEFNPDILLLKWSQNERTLPRDNDLRAAIIQTFSLPSTDTYVYHAIASVTLAQVQEAISYGAEAGLHAWYQSKDNSSLEKNPPPSSDITAYTIIFSPTTSTPKALATFHSNATKNSLRKSVATYLLSQRILPANFTIPRCKNHTNPYFDFWAWSCQCLEWCGPDPSSAAGPKTSHHILPVFMHHFGCVVPSYEALEVVKLVASGREVIDMGSGNGYWTYMLRRQGIKVNPVDSAQSSWRTMWIGDTVVKDGEKYLKDEKGAIDKVLLMVYPVVGADFTRKMIEAYKGRTIVVVGTQNRSGYTAFKDQTIDEWMREQRKGWEKTVQIPLPSFAGLDEAMFVFEKKQ